MKYIFLDWDYFMDGKSGGTVFSAHEPERSSIQGKLIYIPLILIVFGLLFIAPLFVKKLKS